MGVEFFPCSNCDESICDCGSYWRCDDCSEVLCEECAEDLVKYDYECPFCDKELVTEHTLLEFILDKFKVSRESVVEMYRNDKRRKTDFD